MLRRTIVENIDFRKLSNFRFRPGIILSFQKFRIWQYCPKRDCPKREEIHWISFELDSNSQPKSFIWIRKVCSQSKQCFKVLHHFGLTIFFSTFWVDFQTILRLTSAERYRKIIQVKLITMQNTVLIERTLGCWKKSLLLQVIQQH